ncbi:FtsX-like permease family protein [Panacibacter ginsenosidivorans]|uniref:FtsX-like permease family protein n=1 Tax=Panacibacter ginsenosidivorans TaxID=1813871 RepID=A0A5B8VFU7_9BACT|nr:ABC transporter permease [Panacibacter ginsenosidivorans]QEC70003.1 FtsX-like permease family protein [Panacibacter ginsenosidivorans]
MISSYFKIAWRNFKNNKIFSFINIIGLSVGLACCMMITLYIINETSYDKQQPNADNIYQLATIFVQQGQEHKMPNTPAPMAQAMQLEFPEVQQTTRLMGLFAEDKTLLQYNETGGNTKSFYETKGFLTDSTFFRMFSYNFIEGSPASALSKPNTVVLSEEIAHKLFGNQPALNKVIHISSSTNGDHDFAITGVYRPSDRPSHIDGRFFMSMTGGSIEQYIKESGTSFATNNMFFTYLQLKPGTDAKKLAAKFPAFIDKYAGKDLKAMGFDKKQFLVRLKDIHLYSGMDQNVTASGSVTYLYILASIALFTLLIACINFMNLSTARSSKRSAEVGIRKVLGAEKNSLIRQFLGESVFMSVLAFVFAFGITELLLPAFNTIADKHLSLSLPADLTVILAFFALSLITGLLAGSYPAFYLSSFKPIKVLKGRFSNSLAAVSLRKGLVVFQFIISVVLIIASVVIASQMQYLRSADLGFDKDRQIIIPLRSENAKNIYTAFKAEINKQPQVQSVGASQYYPGIFNPADNLLYREGQTMNDAKRTRMNWVDVGYLQTLNVKPVAGRLFSEQFAAADTNYRMILNESAIKEIGFASPQQSIGKKVYFDYKDRNYGFEIIGVVKDFHFEDLHLPITPYGFQLNNESRYNYIIVHAKAGDISKAISSIQNSWHKLNPSEPFEYSFLDDDFQKNYSAENRLSGIVTYFTCIAIFISCLGLFGLATFSAEQRIKEIGVRKVLGASTAGIVTLLSKDFLKLVAVAIVIASPIAWFVMNKWLQDFAYRTNISWTVFLITTVAALLIALITISFQAIRAALMNPVKSLRTE